MSYQKDGPGPLLRCYLDRIHHQNIVKKSEEPFIKNIPKLLCPSCHVTIGMPMVYEKENRFAYLMRQGFFAIKKQY